MAICSEVRPGSLQWWSGHNQAIFRIDPRERFMQDVSLAELLSGHGFEGKNADMALDLLRERGLTRPGKKRIAISKTDNVVTALNEAFIRVCRKDACTRRSAGDLRKQVRMEDARYCYICGGQDNRRAVDEMLSAMRCRGVKKLLVAGGSPSTRNELDRLCNTSCELRFITDEDSSADKKIIPQRDWADIVVIWKSTQISHKMTTALRRSPNVITVTRRGITALADAVCEWAEKGGCRPSK